MKKISMITAVVAAVVLSVSGCSLFDEYSAQKEACYTWGVEKDQQGFEHGGIQGAEVLEESPLSIYVWGRILSLPADWIASTPEFFGVYCTFSEDGSIHYGETGTVDLSD